MNLEWLQSLLTLQLRFFATDLLPVIVIFFGRPFRTADRDSMMSDYLAIDGEIWNDTIHFLGVYKYIYI